jgi:heavy metal translocating P-type ATPase
MAEVVDDGDFLYLDDEVAPPKVKTSKPKKVLKPVDVIIETTPIDTILLDLVVAGEQSISWPLSGMDCPDCAFKATKALNRLDVVSECSVSATEGSVRLVVDLSKGSLSEANTVLTSLGHAPNLGWSELVGVNAAAVSSRLDVDQRGLLKLLKRQSGILDAQIDRDGFVLVQISTDCSPSIAEARNTSLTNLIGHEVSLRASSSRKLRPDQIRLVGGALAIPAFIVVLGLEMISLGPAWLIALIAIFGIMVGGYRMFIEAIASLKSRQIGFQVLTSLAVIGAAILQAWSEALLVIILVAFTAHMEGSALVRAREAMQGGLDRIPRLARQVNEKSKPKNFLQMASSQELTPFAVKKPQCSSEEVPVSLLQIGDIVEVRSGEIIPVDGIVTEGMGSIDRAPLTGESVPVRVEKGDEVLAGLVLKQGPLIIQTTAIGDDTRLSGLIEDVHTFREKPPRLQSSVEVFTAIWIPLVLLGAPLAWFLSGDVENWKIMLLLWVVACPCALLLAAPVPHAASLANAAQSGAIARGGDVMERLGKVNLALLDKTGTLTSGKPRLEQIVMAKGRQESAALKLARGIEARSSHPYAAVVMEYTADLQEVKVSEHQDGEAGVIAKQGTAKVYFGRPDWLQSEGVSIPKELQTAIEDAKEAGHGASLLSKSAKAIALFVFVHDDIRPGAEELIKDLHHQQVNVEILSGDLTTATQVFGPRVGLPAAACRGDLSPDDKASWVGSRSKTHVTMMAGDGFNDAAALANSDVGVAIGSGEQVNLEAADVLVPGDDPRLIGNLLRLAKKTRAIVAQNILISVVITLILVWSVLSQYNDQLWIGVLVHEASAILVILNGARLSGEKGMLRMLLDLGKDLWNDTTDAFKAIAASKKSS